MDKKLVEKWSEELEEKMQLLKRTGFGAQDKSGLKKSEIFMLWHIAKHVGDQPTTTSEIAKKSGVTLAAITHQINALEAQGCIERTNSKDDRRVIFISLSRKGRKTLDRFKKLHRERLTGMIEYLGEEDAQKLISIITKIAEYTSKDKKE